MKTFLVTWQTDVEAETEHEAAVRAMEIQRDSSPENSATVFDVQEYNERTRKHIRAARIDLQAQSGWDVLIAASSAAK